MNCCWLSHLWLRFRQGWFCTMKEWVCGKCTSVIGKKLLWLEIMGVLRNLKAMCSWASNLLFEYQCFPQEMHTFWLKELSVIALGWEKSSKPFRNKEKYLSNHSMYKFFSNFKKKKKNHIHLTEKWLFIRFQSVDPEQCLSSWEIFRKF